MKTGDILVHKEEKNLSRVNNTPFGFSLSFSVLNEEGKRLNNRTIPMTEDQILKYWRYATEEEITQYENGNIVVEMELSK